MLSYWVEGQTNTLCYPHAPRASERAPRVVLAPLTFPHTVIAIINSLLSHMPQQSHSFLATCVEVEQWNYQL